MEFLFSAAIAFQILILLKGQQNLSFGQWFLLRIVMLQTNYVSLHKKIFKAFMRNRNRL